MERKEAIDIIRKNWPDSSFTMLRVALETLIPELVESEDEKIRKYIIDYFKGNKEELSEDFKWNGITVEEVIAWLEKQGEQKPVDKVESKFKVGDKVICLESFDGFIEGQTYSCKEEGWVGCDKQGNWTSHLDKFKLVEQKPDWSEEDKRCLMSAIAACEQAADEYEHSQKYIDAIDWLQSLRPQNTWKPTEEQMEALNDVISSRDIKYDVLSELWKDLKKIREE